jgi:putative membrane protein
MLQMDTMAKTLVSALAFSALGIMLFALAFLIIVKVTPFSLRKEIEEDQNTALAIIIASVIIGIALIVSSAIHG